MQNPWCTCRLSSLYMYTYTCTVLCSSTMVLCSGPSGYSVVQTARALGIWSNHKKYTICAKVCCVTRPCTCLYAWSAVLLHTKNVTSHEALLIVYCNQWWVSQVVRTITSPIHSSIWKEAITVSCPLRAVQKAKKAEVISKCRQNFWKKCFQRNPHNAYIENSTESLIIPELWQKNEVCSS